MLVRSIETNEVDATMILCEYYREEAGIPDEEYDHDSVLQTIKHRSIHPEYCWLNLYQGQRPVGFISGCLTQAPWNSKILYGHIELVFVVEQYRSLDNFNLLVDNFTQWASKFQVREITAGDIGINFARTKKLYEHIGFREGLWMTKELINE